MSNKEWSTVEERADLITAMKEMTEIDVGEEFSFLRPTDMQDQTQYRTKNSMVKKPVRHKKLGLSFNLVELHVDFCRAFEAGRWREAVNLYFQIITLTRRN